MCSPALCRLCGKVTWVGCGLHVEEALAGFAPDQLCLGHDHEPAAQPSPR